MRIVLASGSPRRRELLRLIVQEFSVCSPDVDEHVLESDPSRLVCALAQRKASAAKRAGEQEWIIGADTIVFLDGEVLGKPCDRAHAKAMIVRLAGRVHEVYTGVAVYNTATGTMHAGSECTRVQVSAMTEKQIERYLNAGEYADKAGAYGIQGAFARHIVGICGCYFNVVGMPIHRTAVLLKEAGVREKPY